MTPKRKKITVFLYGSDVFDFVLVKNVKSYLSFRDEMMEQEMEAETRAFFLLAVNIADEQLKYDLTSRMQNIRQSQNITEQIPIESSSNHPEVILTSNIPSSSNQIQNPKTLTDIPSNDRQSIILNEITVNNSNDEPVIKPSINDYESGPLASVSNDQIPADHKLISQSTEDVLEDEQQDALTQGTNLESSVELLSEVEKEIVEESNATVADNIYAPVTEEMNISTNEESLEKDLPVISPEFTADDIYPIEENVIYCLSPELKSVDESRLTDEKDITVNENIEITYSMGKSDKNSDLYQEIKDQTDAISKGDIDELIASLIDVSLEQATQVEDRISPNDITSKDTPVKAVIRKKTKLSDASSLFGSSSNNPVFSTAHSSGVSSWGSFVSCLVEKLRLYYMMVIL